MSDINLSISTGTNVLTQAVGSDEVNLALSSTTNVHTTAIQTENSISIDLVGSVTPTSLLGLTDVNASSITNTQILQFDSSSDTFIAIDLDLNALSDVTISSVANNQVLAYNATSGNFVNISLDSDSFDIDASEIAVNLGSGNTGRLVTVNSDGTLNAETDAIFGASAAALHISSNDQGEPSIILDNHNSAAANPSYIEFKKDKGAAGAAGDDIGEIRFTSDDSGQTQTTFGRILGEVEVATDGQEGGKISLNVASHDAELQPGLIIKDGDAEDEVDVIIGNGSASLTTISGDLSVTTGLILDSVDVTTIQTSAESFANNDTSLMTSAAIQDQILADAPAVTLAGTPDYITISGQEITRNQIDLTADVTGALPIANGGTASTSTTYCDLTSNVTGTLPVGNGGTGATTFTSNALLYGNGTGAVQSSSNLTYSGAIFTITDSDSFQPVLKIENTHNSALSGNIIFSKTRGAGTSADGDRIGQIFFIGHDDAGNTGQTYGLIECTSKESGTGQEGGKIFLQVASHDGSEVTGLTIEDGDADGEVDVTIAAGATSVTTISGTLTMGSTAAITNAGLLSVANQSNVTGVGTISSGTWQGTAIASAYLDADTAHLSGTQTFSGDKTFSGKCTIDSRVYALPGTSDGDHVAGDVVYFGGTTGMTAGKCYYFTNGGQWAEANAGADATATGLLAISLGTASNTDGMLLRGMVTPSAPAGTDDEGKKVYLRATGGALTTDIPTSSGQFVRIVGYMLHASNDAIYFNPDNTYVEIA
tara:strand:- start:1921 stop:4221 length:2301 start_codon:yes stop_codon:yes gene_type:complete